MIHYEASIFNLPVEITEAFYGYFILVMSRQQSISTALESGRELGTNEGESDALALTLAGVILNDISNIKYTARICDWILRATNL